MKKKWRLVRVAVGIFSICGAGEVGTEPREWTAAEVDSAFVTVDLSAYYHGRFIGTDMGDGYGIAEGEAVFHLFDSASDALLQRHTTFALLPEDRRQETYADSPFGT